MLASRILNEEAAPEDHQQREESEKMHREVATPEQEEPPLWVKTVGVLVMAVVLWVVVYFVWPWAIAGVWQKWMEVQKFNYEFCIERKGEVDLGPLGGVTCRGFK